jgi:CMP-N,N'-diacetyllegionaminic acid synthase
MTKDMKYKVACSISARSGSKGVPGKNIKLLGGRPLISYAIESALNSAYIDKVIVSTDGNEIADVAIEYGAEVIIRPSNLADDRTPLIDSTKYTMLALDEKGYFADIIVQLSPTCPFIQTAQIDKSIEMVANNDKCECAVSLKRIQHEHPYRARVMKENYYFENYEQDIDVEAKQFHARQDLPDLYCTNGGLYTRQRHLLENYAGDDFAMGRYHKGIIMDDIESVNIDEMIDYYFAEFLFDSGIKDDPERFNKKI